jgi:muramidase (phage lysozyme)
MNLAQLQRYASNPNVRKMLDLIAYTEGVKHGYNTMFGNQRINSLQSHPNIRKSFVQTDGKSNVTTAAGRYQFLKGTWDGVARQYGLRDFSPQNQDIAALALMAQNGSLPYVLKGDYQTAIMKSGGTWASLPSSQYKQGKRSWNDVNKFLGGNIKTPTQAPQKPSRFLSQDQIAKVLPQLAKGQTAQPSRFLSQDRIAEVLPQLGQQPQLQPQPSQQLQQSQQQQPNRFLNADQIAKVLPQLAKG